MEQSKNSNTPRYPQLQMNGPYKLVTNETNSQKHPNEPKNQVSMSLELCAILTLFSNFNDYVP